MRNAGRERDDTNGCRRKSVVPRILLTSALLTHPYPPIQPLPSSFYIYSFLFFCLPLSSFLYSYPFLFCRFTISFFISLSHFQLPLSLKCIPEKKYIFTLIPLSFGQTSDGLFPSSLICLVYLRNVVFTVSCIRENAIKLKNREMYVFIIFQFHCLLMSTEYKELK